MALPKALWKKEKLLLSILVGEVLLRKPVMKRHMTSINISVRKKSITAMSLQSDMVSFGSRSIDKL